MGGKTTKEEEMPVPIEHDKEFHRSMMGTLEYPPHCLTGVNCSSEDDYNFEITNELDSKIHNFENYDFLPTNNLHLIFLYSKPPDLLNSMLTCKLFFQVINTNFFWKSYLESSEEESIDISISTNTNWKKKYFDENTFFNFDKSNEFFKQKFEYFQRKNAGGVVSFDVLFKLACFGDNKVGKSSIIERFHSGNYTGENKSSIGVDFRITNTRIREKTVKLQIWDTNNNAFRYGGHQNYFKGAHGIFLIFSFDNQKSFDNLTQWMEDVEAYSDENCSVVIIGHKSDLKKKAKWFNNNMISELFKEYNRKFEKGFGKSNPEFVSHFKDFKIQYCECSAKENKNMFLPFGLLLTQVYNCF